METSPCEDKRQGQGLDHKDQDKDKDLTHKDKDKDLTTKDQDKDKDLKYFLKEYLNTRTRINISDVLCIDLSEVAPFTFMHTY